MLYCLSFSRTLVYLSKIFSEVGLIQIYFFPLLFHVQFQLIFDLVKEPFKWIYC